MNFYGKLIGAVIGMGFFKFPGLIAGLIIGHLFDTKLSLKLFQSKVFAEHFGDNASVKQKALFFHTYFACLGHVNKTDGPVSQNDIHIASSMMDNMGLYGSKRIEAQQAYREGKARNFPLKLHLKDFKAQFWGQKQTLQLFIEMLIGALYAQRTLKKSEQQVLLLISETLGFTAKQLSFLITRYEIEKRFRQSQAHRQYDKQGQSNYTETGAARLSDAYKILDVDETDTEKTIKRAYKKLMAQNHPDKLAAKGLPEEALALAKNKTQDIQAAYSLIKKSKGWK